MKRGTTIKRVLIGLILPDASTRHRIDCLANRSPTPSHAIASRRSTATSRPAPATWAGMRASVHVKIPNLTADGTEAKAKAVCKLARPRAVRGTVKIKRRAHAHRRRRHRGHLPSKRLFIKERDIIAKLYSGISDLMVEEKKRLLAGGACSIALIPPRPVAAIIKLTAAVVARVACERVPRDPVSRDEPIFWRSPLLLEPDGEARASGASDSFS